MDQTSESEKLYRLKKYDEIIQSLISAGYNRAKLDNLNEFDKIVGGLCWCITSSGDNVDVDILFSENASIGQRITLAESIVSALQKMNCPIQLQPHQIEGGVGGSDFPVIYTVISWLIKTYFERKDYRDVLHRKFSLFQFSKSFQLPDDMENKDMPILLTKLIRKDKTKRLYKRSNYTKTGSEESQVRACLLEYGESFNSSYFSYSTGSSIPGQRPGSTTSSSTSSSSSHFQSHQGGPSFDDHTTAPYPKSASRTQGASGFEKKLAQMQKEATKEEMMLAEIAVQEEQMMLQQMNRVEGSESSTISGSRIGDLVISGADAIGAAAASYEAQLFDAKKGLNESLSSGKLGKTAAFNRQKQALQQQKKDIEDKANKLQEHWQLQKQRLHLLEVEKSEAVAYTLQLQDQLEKLTVLEESSNEQTALSELKRLVELHTRLKTEESEFKASCREQLRELQMRVQQLEQMVRGEGVEEDEDLRRLAQIEDMHAKVLMKHSRLREMVAEASQLAASTSRRIDDIPTRSELLQYERRFAEVYQQVGWKLDELRKYYDIYNTLDTSLTFLQKEVKLLDTIGDSFEIGMKSTQNKTEFLQQVKQIVNGVQESLDRQEALVSRKSDAIDESKKTLQKLMEEQRRYVKAVQEMQDECVKNEWLVGKLQEQQHSA
eukprot:gene7271-14820_t